MSDSGLHEQFVQAIRSALVNHDGPPNVIPARTFQYVLNSLGLKLGNPLVDNIMLNCEILENGTVDVSRLLNLTTGANSDRPASTEVLTQAERVRVHSTDIHRAFIDFDNGRINTDQLVNRLQAMGIEQTLESRRVLRQIPVAFAALLHALTMTDTTDITDQAAGTTRQSSTTTASIMSGIATPGGADRRHKGLGSFNGAHDRSTDVVTWKKDQMAINRGLNAKLWNTRAIDYNVDLWKGDVIADVLIHGQERPGQRFETETQHAALSGLGEPDIPITSAGYQTADKGLIREQLYSLIRQLDQGAITIKAFRQHLKSMGIPVPPRADRHLQLYASNGRVNFKEFVVAFEDYLQDATVHVEEPPRPDVVPMSTEPWWHTGGRGGKHNPGLQRGYGDIITWQNTQTGGEAPATSRDHEALTFGKRVGFYQGGEHRERNFLAWDANQHRPSAQNTAPERNNVITWQGPSLPEEADAGGRGLTIVGTHHRNRGCPYGTTTDYDTGQPLGGIDGVPHKGGKFVPPDHNAVVGDAWGTGAPPRPQKSYASQNERGHIEHDFTVAAPDKTHGKRHFAGANDAQQDHIKAQDGYVVANGPMQGEGDGGKVLFGDRNVDHVRGIVGS